MSLPRRYNPRTAEPELQESWERSGIYHFSPQAEGPVYSIDTPPATVSGHLHLGHTYSYSQTDFIARFWRMNGYNVFYPMGSDDNGLPTGRFVEKQAGTTAAEMGQDEFVARCLVAGADMGEEYKALWRRLALSVDWRHTYRTIGGRAQRLSQLSFLDLYRKGLVYRRKAPTIWCPECQTAIAQAELDDLERESTFYTLTFLTEDGQVLPIATTRPELLPACVAVFVHPNDERYQRLASQTVTVPLFGQRVPLLRDPGADPCKGTGAVMCCTFGDAADVEWWRMHSLPLIEAIDPGGSLTEAAGRFAGLSTHQGRRQIVQAMEDLGLILDRQSIAQSVRVHERCDRPTEYIVTQQWFLRVLDYREELLEMGEQITWHPSHMKARYRQWVENLGWDWCLSRQRAFGVPFPVWYCRDCDEVVLAREEQLPVTPTHQAPPTSCACGGTTFLPEESVMDTWATSSLTPQIAGQWRTDPEFYERVFPMSLRPQAHDIIRTWAFYTIAKSLHHFGVPPWREVAISGWGIAGEGMGKISKSRGGGPVSPMEMIERYSADAVRYWSASTGLGKDAVISEQKIAVGTKLVNKLWNVARFSQRFLLEPISAGGSLPPLSPADRWILSRTQRTVRRATDLLRGYDYAAAKNEAESFFWTELADNYLEMAKLRLYDGAHPTREGARYALYHALLAVIKLFAPYLPHVTEQIYLGLFAESESSPSIHVARWPTVDPRLEDDASEAAGGTLVEIATAVRRYKSEHSLPLGTELALLELAVEGPAMAEILRQARADLKSITRAREVCLVGEVSAHLDVVLKGKPVTVAIEIGQALRT